MANKPGLSALGVGGGIAVTAVGGGGTVGAGLAAVAGPSASSTSYQEYTVRVPRDRKKKLSVMKFSSGVGVDFAKLANVPVKIERENNLKEYKTANDLDTMPKFGAGSEFGRDQKEEARRKKFGIILKKYNPEGQPWHLKVGSGKQAKKYRGVREGTISENTSYYIFTQCSDGAFEAFPADEWYNFTPMIRYKYLNSEEAEEEFSRRDKTLNYFNIMLKKRVKNEDKDTELDEEEKAAKSKASKAKKKNKNKDFMLTDMEDWINSSEDDDYGDDDDDEKDGEKNKDDEAKDKKKKGKGKGKRVKNAKQNSDDEAIEESDEGDFDDKEVDYISDDSSSSAHSETEEKKKYEEKGVADEGGLRNILNSDDEEEEEEEENKEEEEVEEEEKKEEEKPAKEKRGSESSSSSSDSDSDIDKDDKFTSALLMQKDRLEKKKTGDSKGAAPSASSTDTTDAKGVKRKADGDTSSPASKKSKKDHHAPAASSSNDGITEETIRRYLQRKPMTTKDLLQKFRSKKLNMSNEQMSNMIAHLLKRINPERTTINKKLYLSLKKPE